MATNQRHPHGDVIVPQTNMCIGRRAGARNHSSMWPLSKSGHLVCHIPPDHNNESPDSWCRYLPLGLKHAGSPTGQVRRSGKLCPKLASPAVGQAVARSRVSSANHLETSGRLWRKRIILGIVCTNKLQATLQVHAHAANRAPLCFCKILRSLLLKLS